MGGWGSVTAFLADPVGKIRSAYSQAMWQNLSVQGPTEIPDDLATQL